VRAFRQALKDTGYVEGENAAIVYRWAEGRYDRLPELAAGLVRRQVAMIAASDSGSANAAKAATTTIPIVFGVSEDPVHRPAPPTKSVIYAALGPPPGGTPSISVQDTSASKIWPASQQPAILLGEVLSCDNLLCFLIVRCFKKLLGRMLHR
jgi:hypothetical protein